MHPVVRTGGCRWRAWGVGLSRHRTQGAVGPSSRTRDRCTAWVGEGEGVGDGGWVKGVLDTDHPSSWSGCRRLFPRSGRRRRIHPLCPSMRCTATCPTATSRVICGARPPLRSTFGTRAPLALRRFRRCCSPPSPLAFVRRLRSDACHSCVERTRTVFSQFCITPLISPISLLFVRDPSAPSRPSSCASSSVLVAVRASTVRWYTWQ